MASPLSTLPHPRSSRRFLSLVSVPWKLHLSPLPPAQLAVRSPGVLAQRQFCRRRSGRAHLSVLGVWHSASWVGCFLSCLAHSLQNTLFLDQKVPSQLEDSKSTLAIMHFNGRKLTALTSNASLAPGERRKTRRQTSSRRWLLGGTLAG